MKTRVKNALRFALWLAALTFVRGGIVSAQQTFTTLHHFQSPVPEVVGGAPNCPLILSSNRLYGTTWGSGEPARAGGADVGTVFAINTDGTGFTNIYIFHGDLDGAHPEAGLVLSGNSLSGNSLYGTAALGGMSGSGSVFDVPADGSGEVYIYNFTDIFNPASTNGDGALPGCQLVLAGNTLYGTAEAGGTSAQGTVFAVNTDGSGFTNLYSFSAINGAYATNSDGASPAAGLVLSDGVLYGTTGRGGDAGFGTVFSVSTNGTGFRTLHSFTQGTGSSSFDNITNSDGANPFAPLIVSDGILYGTTQRGGSYGWGTVFKLNVAGIDFTNLHSFTGGNDGSSTVGGPLALSGSILYGAAGGGYARGGTIFAVSTDGGNFTTLYSFSETPSSPTYTNIYGYYSYANKHGAFPFGGLLLSRGTLYGVTSKGGEWGQGTLFSLSLPLPGSPVIVSQPLNQTNFAGSTASFSVVATGTAPLSYQWLKGANLISQATNSTLTLTGVSDADASSYSVIVSNLAGYTLSAAAVLTVIDKGQAGDFIYTPVNGAPVITIVGYTGSGGNVVIPSTINGMTVVKIGDSAFAGLSSLTSVTIPGTVTSIGDEVFFSCSNLATITIAASVMRIGSLDFENCPKLQGIFFEGDAPNIGPGVSTNATLVTVYYVSGTTGWTATFGGFPTALWVLPYPLILMSGTNFGVLNNQFGFIVSWRTNAAVVVEATTNLANPIWFAVSTNSLTIGWFYFRDPQWGKYSTRFYRVRSQ